MSDSSTYDPIPVPNIHSVVRAIVKQELIPLRSILKAEIEYIRRNIANQNSIILRLQALLAEHTETIVAHLALLNQAILDIGTLDVTKLDKEVFTNFQTATSLDIDSIRDAITELNAEFSAIATENEAQNDTLIGIHNTLADRMLSDIDNLAIDATQSLSINELATKVASITDLQESLAQAYALLDLLKTDTEPTTIESVSTKLTEMKQTITEIETFLSTFV